MVIHDRSGVYKEFRPGHWKALGGVGGGVGWGERMEHWKGTGC